jgi:ferredoxin-thioredoxin reductase catalytic chain
MRERNECHCMLFLTEDNPFRAEDASIGYQEIKDLTDNPEDI